MCVLSIIAKLLGNVLLIIFLSLLFCFVSHRVSVLMRHFVFGLASGNVMFIVFSPGLCLKTTHVLYLCVCLGVSVRYCYCFENEYFFFQLVLFIIIIGIVTVFT